MGRRALFVGERAPLTVKLTGDAIASIRRVRSWLETRHGHSATDGAAVEFLLRYATGMSLDASRDGDPRVDEIERAAFESWLRRGAKAKLPATTRESKAARAKRIKQAQDAADARKLLQKVSQLVSNIGATP